jgi:hypothetical protein
MFDCRRCGTSFSPMRIASSEACPRCLAREGVRAPLTYSLFSEVSGARKTTQAPQPEALEPSQGVDLGDAPTAP